MVDKTHYAECWKDPWHHACALREIERLRAVVMTIIIGPPGKLTLSADSATLDWFEALVASAHEALGMEADVPHP